MPGLVSAAGLCYWGSCHAWPHSYHVLSCSALAHVLPVNMQQYSSSLVGGATSFVTFHTDSVTTHNAPVLPQAPCCLTPLASCVFYGCQVTLKTSLHECNSDTRSHFVLCLFGGDVGAR